MLHSHTRSTARMFHRPLWPLSVWMTKLAGRRCTEKRVTLAEPWVWGQPRSTAPSRKGSGTELIQHTTLYRVLSQVHCYSIRPQTLVFHHPTITSAPVLSCVQEDFFFSTLCLVLLSSVFCFFSLSVCLEFRPESKLTWPWWFHSHLRSAVCI